MPNELIIPTEQPASVRSFKILLDGEEMDASYKLESLVVYKEVNRVPMAKISILDGDPSTQTFEASDKGPFAPGKAIEIKAGYGSDDATIFKGVIVRHGVRAIGKKNGVLRLEAKDDYVGLTIGRNSAYFYESLDSEIIEEILGNYKKKLKSVTRKAELKMDVEPTSVKHEEMVQYHASDWDFILTRAEKNGMLVFLDDGNFTVAKPKLTEAAVQTLVYGATVLEFETEMDAMSQYGSVESAAWNISDQDLVTGESEEPKMNEQGKLSGEELSAVLAADTLLMQHTGDVIDKELTEWSKAKLLKSRLAMITGRVKCPGFTGIVPGNIVELKGFGDHFNGNVFVSGIRHAYTQENWELDISFGLKENWFSDDQTISDIPAGGLVPAIHGLHIGIVTQIEGDPASEYRLLVRAPMISAKDDGIWARVALPDAGSERGVYFRPEIGDEVVLGFLNDDPRDPIVLGALHSSKNVSPVDPSDDNDEKGIYSREKMKLSFDDKDKIIYLQTGDGKNTIRLDEKEEGVFIEDQNGNKIHMTSDGITLESGKDIVFKATGDIKMEGVNLSAEAKSKLALSGKSGAELKTNGIAVVKGDAMVQIN